MIKLSEIPTTAPQKLVREKVEQKTKKLQKRLGALQHLMYAEQKRSLLVVFQGMDASGKDGATRRVFNKCSTAGIHVFAFKKPSSNEFAHDFLWRIHQRTPRKGMIHVFNRSHYEDVLIQRVHGWISEEHAQKRIQAINAFEELLEFDNNTTVLKFYMHLSKKQQKIELQERIDDPEKHWKYSQQDWEERKHWNNYMRCYEDAFNKSTIPWEIIPVDNRWYRNYLILKKIVQTMEGFNMQLPTLEEVNSK